MGAACCGQPSSLRRLVGPATAAVCPPGRCVFGEEWSPAALVDRLQISHDTILVTFELPDKAKPLGLSTCACILCKFVDPTTSEPVVRPYTPVSTNALIGKVQLLVKVYEMGKMSQHLNSLPLGSSLDFRHAAPNVKIQYPFKRKHVTMLAGGTGITPMIQALHAILGTKEDDTQVSLIFGNKTQSDILCEDLLERWAEESEGRLRVLHVLEAAGEGSGWRGARGRICRELVEAHAAPPSQDTLILVCGPPPMYDALCGPRDQKELSGVLKEMGYSAEQVFKF